MGRAPCCDKANVKKGPWSPEEDAKLKSYIEKNGIGGNWIALPQKIGLKRCGKSCRLRWLNYLRPNIKHGGFSEEEDHIICSLYLSIGSRWSIIAGQLPGRTDNDIKNYWNTRLKKKLLGSKQRYKNQIRTNIPSSVKQEEIHEREIIDNNAFVTNQFQQSLALAAAAPIFQDQEQFGGSNLISEGQFDTSLINSMMINGTNGTTTTSNYFDNYYNGQSMMMMMMSSGSFNATDDYYNINISEQIWEGGLDQSFSSLQNYENSIQDYCTIHEYSRKLQMQHPHYNTVLQ